jgi:hypothetical protein
VSVATLREFGKKVLPDPALDWYRRRRAIRQYLGQLGYELVDVARLEFEDEEGRLAARRAGFYEGLLKDVLERTDLILKELDRRIEGVAARHGNELRSLRDEVESLRAALERLESSSSLPAARGNGSSESTAAAVTPAGKLPRD